MPSKNTNHRGESDSSNTTTCKVINNLFAIKGFSSLFFVCPSVTFNNVLDMIYLSLQIHSPSFPALLWGPERKHEWIASLGSLAPLLLIGVQ